MNEVTKTMDLFQRGMIVDEMREKRKEREEKRRRNEENKSRRRAAIPGSTTEAMGSSDIMTKGAY